jgi:hypothetical protein
MTTWTLFALTILAAFIAGVVLINCSGKGFSMFSYRVGFPGWKFAAKLGLPLKVRAYVVYDDEAKCLVAECNDFLPVLGIVTEGASFEELNRKLQDCVAMAMEETFKNSNAVSHVHPSMRLVPSLP